MGAFLRAKAYPRARMRMPSKYFCEIRSFFFSFGWYIKSGSKIGSDFYFFIFIVSKFSFAFAQGKLEINLIIGYELLCKKKKKE